MAVYKWTWLNRVIMWRIFEKWGRAKTNTILNPGSTDLGNCKIFIFQAMLHSFRFFLWHWKQNPGPLAGCQGICAPTLNPGPYCSVPAFRWRRGSETSLQDSQEATETNSGGGGSSMLLILNVLISENLQKQRHISNWRDGSISNSHTVAHNHR